jgi:hypothetical protein
MADLTAMLQAAAGAGEEETDPNFNQTVLLLHGDGTNGAQNNTFLDSSTNTFTITRNGNTTQGTFSPFSLADGQWSNYFNGSSYFTSSTALFNYTTGNAATQTFTIEAWVYHTARTIPSFAYLSQSIATKGAVYLNLGINGSGNLIFHHYSGVSTTITGSSVIPLNTWTYVAVVVSGGTATIYINGVSDGSDTWGGIDAGGQNSTSFFGSPSGGATAQKFQGYISNLRVSSTARSTAVPTAPYTNDGDTVFLIEQSNRFVDNSTNGYALAVVGAPSVQPFSPFLPSAAYSPSVNGGSGLFGTGNYLTAPDDNFWDLTASTGSIEMFLYSTTTQTNGNGLVGQNSATGDWGGYVYADGKIAIGIQGSSELATASGNLVNNSWIHVVFTRDNSTGRTRTFVNGVLKATGTGTYFAVSSNPLQIINFNDGVNRSFIGYVADIRFCKGSIPTDYQTASTTVDASIFTPPTAPLTVSSQGATSADTELLLNFTNAGIFDNTGKNNLETVGNAQIDTSVKKYGTGSMEFDGSGDYLKTPIDTKQTWNFGTGDFTVEAWVYPTAAGSLDVILGTNSGGATGGWQIIYDSPNAGVWNFNFQVSGGPYGFSLGSLSLNTWSHIAVTRSGTTVRTFVNGTQITSSTTGGGSNIAESTGTLYIGQAYENIGGRDFNGYIDDLRITNGVARYTSAFTPPTAAFPDL